MNLIESVKTCFKKYGVIDGRASRSEYWYFVLFYLLMNFIVTFTEGFLNIFPYYTSIFGMILFFLLIIPYFTVSTRRLHDVNRSGWWQLLLAIPFIGWVILLFFYVKKSEEDDNRFGSNSLV